MRLPLSFRFLFLRPGLALLSFRMTDLREDFFFSLRLMDERVLRVSGAYDLFLVTSTVEGLVEGKLNF